MNDFIIEDNVLIRYKGDDEVVTVPDGVKRIQSNAFLQRMKIIEIVLPEGLEYIGSMAFKECTRLKKLKIPKSVKVIGESAFKWCDSLQEIEITRYLESTLRMLEKTFGFKSIHDYLDFRAHKETKIIIKEDNDNE